MEKSTWINMPKIDLDKLHLFCVEMTCMSCFLNFQVKKKKFILSNCQNCKLTLGCTSHKIAQ